MHRFLEMCERGELVEEIPETVGEVKVSIFLPTYNKRDFLLRLIRSIQNQKFKDYEMVFIDDCSTDDSVKLLQEFQKEDKRIRIVKNNKNSGSQYSRGMGVLNSTGDYLLAFDPDDMMASPNILGQIYAKALETNADIVQFNFVKGYVGKYMAKYFHYDHKGLYVQDNLANLTVLYTKNGTQKITNYLIWNKLVKRMIYQKLIKYLEYTIINYRWNYFDDIMWSFDVMYYSKSIYFMETYGYFWWVNDFSLWGMYDDSKYQRFSLNFVYLIKEIRRLLRVKQDWKLMNEMFVALIRQYQNQILYQMKGKLRDEMFSMWKELVDKEVMSQVDKNFLGDVMMKYGIVK